MLKSPAFCKDVLDDIRASKGALSGRSSTNSAVDASLFDGADRASGGVEGTILPTSKMGVCAPVASPPGASSSGTSITGTVVVGCGCCDDVDVACVVGSGSVGVRGVVAVGCGVGVVGACGKSAGGGVVAVAPVVVASVNLLAGVRERTRCFLTGV